MPIVLANWLISLWWFLTYCLTSCSSDCQYRYPEKYDPARIRLCVSNRWVPWLNTSIGMIHENTTIFCESTSLVHNYFSLVKLAIPYYGEIQTSIIEESCDLVISVTNGIYFHQTYNGTTSNLLPLVLAYPSQNPDILVFWSNKLQWRQWMISNGFGNYVARSVNLSSPAAYPFIMKEGLSENSLGVSVIQNAAQLQAKLEYFNESRITNYYGEEALTGMGRAQGIFYISAFQGKVLNIQCYVYLIRRNEIDLQNFTQSIFIAGSPPKLASVRGGIHRVKYELSISTVLRKIAKMGMYTGVFCAEFKMNRFKQIVFMEFNARICYKLTQKDTYFIEAYLPLAFSVQKHIRTIKPYTRRLYKIVSGSHQWYGNKTMSAVARGFHLQSSESIEAYSRLPTLTEKLLERESELRDEDGSDDTQE